MKTKTYILKRPVYNDTDFPEGTIVIITDDFWGKKSNNSLNTGFTVIEGELKGEKGCVADGLSGYLIDDTPENRAIFNQYKKDRKKLQSELYRLDKLWNELPTSNL